MRIVDIIQKVVETNDSLTSQSSERGVAAENVAKIPTLEQGCYRGVSPMLKERYSVLGHWRNATHGHWLSLDEMEMLWHDSSDPYITRLQNQIKAFSENWPNDASSLFKGHRISVFAIDDNGNEHIYMVWLDDVEEPEFWVYDSNGMARYENLRNYLEAYLSDDLSAYNKNPMHSGKLNGN